MRVLMVSMLLLAVLPLTAQTNQPVRLELKCGKEPCSFRIGEVIPLDLLFTGVVPKRYQLNMASYDRSGRMNYEIFGVSPREGTHDPLRTYFAFGGFTGGGLTGFDFLSAEPRTISLVLNEWVSFDRPGVYRVNVSSSRVNDGGKAVSAASN